MRHFAGLRDGSHGAATSRPEKERLFAEAVALLDPYARQALEEIDADLLLDTGEITATAVRRSATAGLDSVWALSCPEQRAARIGPIVIRAYFGIGSPHPHLQSATLATKQQPRRPAPTYSPHERPLDSGNVADRVRARRQCARHRSSPPII